VVVVFLKKDGLSGRYWLYLELGSKSQMCPNRGASLVAVSDFEL
jgi:hypothetical protein